MSKGKRNFTASEARKIRSLLASKQTAPRPDQKVIRQHIRDIGFFISDFDQSGSGFTKADFDQLVASGEIRIQETWWSRLVDWLRSLLGIRDPKP